MTSFRLDGLRALITAGGSGIGRVIAKYLFEAGARVHAFWLLHFGAKGIVL